MDHIRPQLHVAPGLSTQPVSELAQHLLPLICKDNDHVAQQKNFLHMVDYHRLPHLPRLHHRSQVLKA